MKKYILFLFSLLILMVIACEKRQEDRSFSSGSFSGSFSIKAFYRVGSDIISTENTSESGQVHLIVKEDKMNFRFSTSAYNVNRDYDPKGDNEYYFIEAATKLVDKFNMNDVGMTIEYYGTREMERAEDTFVLYEVTFSGTRE